MLSKTRNTYEGAVPPTIVRVLVSIDVKLLRGSPECKLAGQKEKAGKLSIVEFPHPMGGRLVP
jgi:hypothetical protein